MFVFPAGTSNYLGGHQQIQVNGWDIMEWKSGKQHFSIYIKCQHGVPLK